MFHDLVTSLTSEGETSNNYDIPAWQNGVGFIVSWTKDYVLRQYLDQIYF